MSDSPCVTIGQHSRAGRKARNDDSYGVLIPDAAQLATKGIAMAIADGMSSSAGAKEASETCVKTFLNDYYCTPDSWTVKTSVGRVVTAVNRWLYAQGQLDHLPGRGLVSTFSGLVLKSATAHIFHVGDSRIYRFRDQVLEPLTRDHRLRVSRDRDYLSRGMGVDASVEIDYRIVSMAAGDVLLFTTDGVHDFLPAARLAEILSAPHADLNAMAEAITQAAFDEASPDNLTCQIVRIDRLGLEDEDSHTRKFMALPFPPALAPGMRIDGYKILRELHASKRSQVYLALDEESDRKVVLKTPSPNYDDDPVYLELFTREEWVGKRLDHPHVAKIIEPNRPKNFLYTVVDYVDGQTLRQWMHENPAPALSDVRAIVEQIASGLRAFHRKEMIHQDLKPENIMIDRHGMVKIVDFGSAKIAGLEEIASPIDRPALLGTAGYTAPEYFLGHTATNRTDLFSLGVIAYEMLTGKLPYGEGFSARRSVDRRTLTPAQEHNPAVPAWVAAALAKAVHRDPARRYDSLSEFLMDLSRPNPTFAIKATAPLLERNPIRFWRGLALALLFFNVLLLMVFLAR